MKKLPCDFCGVLVPVAMLPIHRCERMDELDKIEWFDVARKLKPGLTEEEYERLWADFQRAKREKELS